MFYLDRRKVERFKDRQKATDSVFKLNLNAFCSFYCELVELFLHFGHTEKSFCVEALHEFMWEL